MKPRLNVLAFSKFFCVLFLNGPLAALADTPTIRVEEHEPSRSFYWPSRYEIPGSESVDNRVEISYDVNARIGILWGEPVVSMHWRYDLRNWDIAVPTYAPGERYTRLSALYAPQDMPGPRPYDVDVALYFTAQTSGIAIEHVKIVENVGATSLSGEWSFNTPGSPNWDDLMVYANSTFEDPVPGELAKEFYRRGLEFNYATIESINWSNASAESWLADNNKAPSNRAKAEALDHLLDAIEKAYGYDVSRYRHPPENYDPSIFTSTTPDSLDSALTNARELHENLRRGEDEIFEDALEDVNEVIALLEEDKARDPVIDVDVDSLPQGVDVPFDSELTPMFAQLPLEFKVYDHASEDGDRVRLKITDADGLVLEEVFTLRNSGHFFAPNARAGGITLSLEALSEGSSSPNTGTITILSRITAGPNEQEYSLTRGQVGELVIYAPPQ